VPFTIKTTTQIQRHLLWQFTVKVVEIKSRSHWHKVCPNVCNWRDTVETASLANHQIVSGFGGQPWTVSCTNLNAVWRWKQMHITENQYTTDHETKHILYAVYPVIPVVVQLINIFPRILWKLRYITAFIRMTFNALSKHECSKSTLIQYLKIHSNIILPYSHRPSQWTLSFLFSHQNPSWYSSLKPISILLSYIHTGLLNGLFSSHFTIKNLFTISFTPMQATFLTHFATVVWYPSIWQAVQIMKLHIIQPFPPTSAIFNPLEHTAGCQSVETSMSFACNSSFLSVDGMTCLIPFESWRNTLSNGVSYV